MLDGEDDPYELHARHFLARLQRHSHGLAHANTSVDLLIANLDKVWPQVLAAYWWAARERTSSAGRELCDALMACTTGDIVDMNHARAAADLRKLADSIAATAIKRGNPNDAAFLFRVAGIAKIQAGILEIVEQTGADIRTVLELASQSPLPWREDASKCEDRHQRSGDDSGQGVGSN